MSELKVKNLSKKFKSNDFYSLKDANIEIRDGDIVGLVGKNGAGKSTFLKLLAKSYIPTEGVVELNGKNIYEYNNALRNVGVMIEPVFYPYLSCIDNLKFYLKIHNKTNYLDNIKVTLEMVDLWEKRNEKPQNFSFGMKQRLALAMALVDEPDFLLLDEPFVGLDPYGVRELIDILQNWVKSRNVSMIISSHQLHELESICNRFFMIDKGSMCPIDIENEGHLENYFNGGGIL